MIHILISAEDGYYLNQSNKRRQQFFQNLYAKSKTSQKLS
jgi:hypothetical protein